MDKQKMVPIIDFLIINIPAWLFLVGQGVSLFFCLMLSWPRNLFAYFLLWWCLCGMILMIIDYAKRKRGLYLRMREVPLPTRGSSLYGSLHGTVCGLALFTAVRRYSRTIRAVAR